MASPGALPSGVLDVSPSPVLQRRRARLPYRTQGTTAALPKLDGDHGVLLQYPRREVLLWHALWSLSKRLAGRDDTEKTAFGKRLGRVEHVAASGSFGLHLARGVMPYPLRTLVSCLRLGSELMA